ncbi:MAG: type II toxin-antitoxin system PrlF family antitoxin [Deltaproteobacteria bacterium]|nr:type II toxin-antitoxin system PrlF family antitoxin [Deltaproteobacteria bacterium]
METLITSKLTTKFQTTIPEKIRTILGIHAGDSVSFEITSNKQVFIRKVNPMDLEFAKALEETMSEWLSEHDEEAYRDL